MNALLLTSDIRTESDVVFVRQRARQIAALLEFDAHEQTRISTAVSEIVRNAFLYAGGGQAHFSIEGSAPEHLIIRISDRGQGIPNLPAVLAGHYTSGTGMGLGLLGARKLMDTFRVDSVPGEGTTVELGKALPHRAPKVTPQLVLRISAELAKLAPTSPMEEIRQQNIALLRALDELRARQLELDRMSREVAEVNGRMIDVNSQLEDKADALQQANTLKDELIVREQAAAAELVAAREREGQIGFRIQQMLLLTQPPRDVAGLQMAALTIPSQRIDGDFYDFFKHENQSLDVIVADVMGKGVPAALLAAATKSNFLEALCHLMALSKAGALPEPKDIVTLAHADMVGHLIDLESFVTLSYARLDLNRHRVDLVDCGHTGMIVVRATTGFCEILHGDNLPLGIRAGEIFSQIAVPFEPGDLFLFYSDGITETRDAAGELFGAARLSDCVQLNRTLEPEALVEAIRRAVFAFAASDTPNDDLTCVAIRVSEREVPLARADMEVGSDLGELRRVREFVRTFCRVLVGRERRQGTREQGGGSP